MGWRGDGVVGLGVGDFGVGESREGGFRISLGVFRGFGNYLWD